MHQSSYEHMKDLIARYLVGKDNESLSILDIGSSDVNGSYRPLFNRPAWRYLGVDLAAGPNVDIVLDTPYSWRQIGTHTQDLLISGQAFEHIEYFWITWLEMVRVLRPGGHIFLIAPSRGPEHRYPQDCWRFYPDGYRALARLAQIELVEVSTDWEPSPYPDSAAWGDTVGVFRQPALTLGQRAIHHVRPWLRRFTSEITRRV